MTKSPDADPEKFIIGQGGYDNLQTACPYSGDGVFRIDPCPMPVGMIVSLNLLFLVFFGGFSFAINDLTHGDAGPWFIYGAPIGVGLMTCVLVTVVIYWRFAEGQRLGPWLIYEKGTGRVELPREGVSFDRNDIVHFQYITTKRLNFGGVTNNNRLSELNLITCRDGVRKRWPLLRSISTIKAFDHLLKPLIEDTELPVVRVQDEWLGWKVTETAYG